MISMEYAVVDIETTGGAAVNSGITEIAILIYNGREVTERFESLVDPEHAIPKAIEALTGINEDMVAHCPTFSELAPKVYQMLQNRVFVAHNVNFDYSFIKHHLQKAGLEWSAPKLCTVRMSRKLRPGLRSYSLARLCDALDIPMQGHHRAGVDATATAVLLGRLLEWDSQGHIPDMLKKKAKEQRLPPHLPPEIFENLPSCTGVYYFKDGAGKVIYVGKAVDIKKRVAGHFSGHNAGPQRQSFLRHVHHIDYEPCATELMAFLLECVEIKRLWPAYNKALKRFEPKFALYAYEDQNNYVRLAIGKAMGQQPCVHAFDRLIDATHALYKMIETFDIVPSLCYFGPGSEKHRPGTGQDALPERDVHNDKVRKALARFEEDRPHFILLDKGRHDDEHSCICIEKGRFYGMGYIDKHTDLHRPEDIKESLSRHSGNHYMAQLICSHAEKFPQKVRHL